MTTPRDDGRVRIPADVDREDRILAGLTARQVALLAVPAVGLWLLYTATRTLIPPLGFAVLALPVAAAVGTLVLARRDGLSADRFALAALRHHWAPHRLVPTATEPVPLPELVAGIESGPPPEPLRLPVSGIDTAGVLDLGADGAAVLCEATAVSFTLRTSTEQAGMVAAFGRYLNSLPGHFQILIRADPVDLTLTIARLREAAGGLPHPGLDAAARGHADFLTALAARRSLLRRQVLLILRDPNAAAAEQLGRWAEDAATALAPAGITVTRLDTATATRRLAAATDPWSPPVAEHRDWSDDVVTGADL